MFRKSSDRRRRADTATLVGPESRVLGDIEFTGGCHIDGYVKGNVRALDDESAVLSISERGCVEGAVAAPQVILNGTVKGDLLATERVELGPKARVIGNVQYGLIEMSIGAEVNGKLMHRTKDQPAAQAAAQLETARPANAIGD